MLKPWRTIAVVTAFGAAVLTVSSLYADTTQNKGRSMMGEGGMMGRMGEMRGMMEGCSRMMGMRSGGSERPNDQWHRPAPGTPEKKN